jgi:ribosome-associated toxin RatA of RatAB toxin-antitoxin module
VDVTAGLTAPCAPPALFALVDDLSRYPDWLDLITRCTAGS